MEATSRQLRRSRRARDADPLEAALTDFIAAILADQQRRWQKAVRPTDDFSTLASVGTVEVRWREVTRQTESAFTSGMEEAYMAAYAIGARRAFTAYRPVGEAIGYLSPLQDWQVDELPLDKFGHPNLAGTVFDVRNPRAVNYAKEQAARLVRNVDNATRESLKRSVTYGVRKGQSTDVIRQSILRYQPAFSRYRADTIAITETAFAYEQGQKAMADTLKQAGLRVEKAWLTAGDGRVDDVCGDNEAQGYIPEDQDFGDGSDVPPAHPRCRCTTERRTIAPEAPPKPPPPPPPPAPPRRPPPPRRPQPPRPGRRPAPTLPPRPTTPPVRPAPAPDVPTPVTRKPPRGGRSGGAPKAPIGKSVAKSPAESVNARINADVIRHKRVTSVDDGLERLKKMPHVVVDEYDIRAIASLPGSRVDMVGGMDDLVSAMELVGRRLGEAAPKVAIRFNRALPAKTGGHWLDDGFKHLWHHPPPDGAIGWIELNPQWLIRGGTRYDGFSTARSFHDAVVHEYGHAVSTLVGRVTRYSESSRLRALQDAYAKAGKDPSATLSRYAGQAGGKAHPDEFFAEQIAAMMRVDYQLGTLPGEEVVLDAIRDALENIPKLKKAGRPI